MGIFLCVALVGNLTVGTRCDSLPPPTPPPPPDLYGTYRKVLEFILAVGHVCAMGGEASRNLTFETWWSRLEQSNDASPSPILLILSHLSFSDVHEVAYGSVFWSIVCRFLRRWVEISLF